MIKRNSIDETQSIDQSIRRDYITRSCGPIGISQGLCEPAWKFSDESVPILRQAGLQLGCGFPGGSRDPLAATDCGNRQPPPRQSAEGPSPPSPPHIRPRLLTPPHQLPVPAPAPALSPSPRHATPRHETKRNETTRHGTTLPSLPLLDWSIFLALLERRNGTQRYPWHTSPCFVDAAAASAGFDFALPPPPRATVIAPASASLARRQLACAP